MIYINVILKIAISIIIMMPLVTSLNQAYFNLENTFILNNIIKNILIIIHLHILKVIKKN